ncbi:MULTISPECIES: ATP-binding protein [Halorussus]|uniref:ATP-binding protein n=1 Tax=Halorussus TaxID=1070314 RepID=UPI00209D8306|nr:ATP-binding protein [Halorussus vallis]USZ76655.1 ATP-binding protein [Halorussus vallis]
MTIISLEGASAVGKTTTAEVLCDEFDAYRVPEVNALFDTSKEDSTTWYFERQCDRWEIAIDREKEHEFVVLDGDVLQPLWYNWIAHHLSDELATVEEFAPLDSICHFFREKVQEQSIGFPDRYFLLFTDDNTLKQRKGNDEKRTRRNFESHLQFATPQRRYFEKLQTLSPKKVRFVRAQSVNTNRDTIRAELPSSDDRTGRYSLDVLDAIFDWAEETSPS